MRRLAAATLALSTLAACGVKEEDFRTEFIADTCEATLECSTDDGFTLFDTQEDCQLFLSLFWGELTDGCDYDKKAAKECLKASDGMTCEESEEMPAECADVYTGSACPWNSESNDSGYAWDTGWR